MVSSWLIITLIIETRLWFGIRFYTCASYCQKTIPDINVLMGMEKDGNSGELCLQRPHGGVRVYQWLYPFVFRWITEMDSSRHIRSAIPVR